MKRIVVAVLTAVALQAAAQAQTILCETPTPPPDDIRGFPGLVSSGPTDLQGTAIARLYLSPDRIYDKPVVIPNPFEPTEQTDNRITPEKLYELLSPFIERVRAIEAVPAASTRRVSSCQSAPTKSATSPTGYPERSRCGRRVSMRGFPFREQERRNGLESTDPFRSPSILSAAG